MEKQESSQNEYFGIAMPTGRLFNYKSIIRDGANANDDLRSRKVKTNIHDSFGSVKFGSNTCQRFYSLTSDRKLWKQIIERQGLMNELLKRRGGKANLKRIKVMQKTYKAHQDVLPNLRKAAWRQLRSKFCQYLRKDQCTHSTILYNREYGKLSCQCCCSYAFADISQFNYVLQYFEVTRQLDATKVTISCKD